MMKFCDKHNILSNTQFDFRRETSCIYAIATVTEFSISELIKNQQLTRAPLILVRHLIGLSIKIFQKQ